MDRHETIETPVGCYRAVCEGCNRSVYLPLPNGLVEGSPLSRAGWGRDEAGALLCDLCLALGKETKQEAAAAYDAETVERLNQLILDLSLSDRITPSAFEKACEVLGVLKCAVNNPSIRSWGENCRGERGQATNEEAL